MNINEKVEKYLNEGTDVDQLKKGKTVKIPVPNTTKAWVKVSKHPNGYYAQLIYNSGDSGDKIHILDTAEKALKKAEQLAKKY